MDEDTIQITQLQNLNVGLYALVAKLRREISVLRESVAASQIGIYMLNRTLMELDERYYSLRVVHNNLLELYNEIKNISR